MNEKKMNWLIPIGIIAIILLVSGLAFMNISQNDEESDGTDNTEEVAENSEDNTPTEDEDSNDEDTESTEPEDEPTATPTATPTPTNTPTPTPSSGEEIEADLNTNWQPGVRVQTVGSAQYTVDGKDLKKNGTSVYTSKNGDINAFYVTSSFIVINEGRNPSTNESRVIKYFPGSGGTSLVYKYIAARMEINSFMFNSKDKTIYYLAFASVDGSLKPEIMFEEDYQEAWSKSYSSASAGDEIKFRGVSANGETLYFDLVSGDDSELVEFDL